MQSILDIRSTQQNPINSTKPN